MKLRRRDQRQLVFGNPGDRRVSADTTESIYGNMPRWGLAEAFDHVAVGSTNGQSAAKRIGAVEEDAPALEPY
jgi:hypothetical protein